MGPQWKFKKYVNVIFIITENSHNLLGVAYQCSRFSLPTGLETSYKKSENVKSFATPISTNDPWLTARNLPQIFLQSLKNTWKCMLLLKVTTNLCKINEQSSLCLLPTGSETSNQKSENVKSFATPISTNDPSFIMIGCIKTQLHPQGTWTCGIPLWGWQCGIYHLYIYRAFKISEFACYCWK